MLTFNVHRAVRVSSRLGKVRGVHVVSGVSYQGRELVLETGLIGPLTDSVVFARYGGTSVLASAVSSYRLSEEDSLPLSVEYRERSFAFNAIPDSRTRREAGGSDREVLVGRVVDRSLRPLFSEGYFYDTQVIVTLLSHDRDCDPTMLSVLASSASLHASSIPWNGPAACVHVGWCGGNPLVCPPVSALTSSDSHLDLVYSGATGGRALMLELGARQLPEASVAEALEAAHTALQPLFALQEEFAAKVGAVKRNSQLMAPSHALIKAVEEAVYEEAKGVFKTLASRKEMRSRAQGQLIHKAMAVVKEGGGQLSNGEVVDPRKLGLAAQSVVRKALREAVLDATSPSLVASAGSAFSGGGGGSDGGGEGLSFLDAPPGSRIDGRGSHEVRPLLSRVDVIPGIHGSGLFGRGDTQVLAAVTLGPVDMATLVAPGPAYLPAAASGSTFNPLRLSGRGGGGGGGEGEGGASNSSSSTSSSSSGVSHAGGDDTPNLPRTFFLHYDFPPYATNETGKVGGAALNRRTIGHGALGEKALAVVIPPVASFPYAIRVVGETTGSDGSSSMATVCAGTLALLDAGVPIVAPVAGVSIGVFSTYPTASPKEGGEEVQQQQQQPTKYALLTDILGLEDYAGDMDFKVAGTWEGVTAAQLDVKTPLPLGVILAALPRAQVARGGLLKEIEATAGVAWGGSAGSGASSSSSSSRGGSRRGASSSSSSSWHRPTLKPSAPSVEVMDLPPELRARLIGPGGSNVRRIESLSGSTLVLDTDSTTLTTYGSPHALAAANALITASVSEALRSSGSPLSLSLKGPPGSAPESTTKGGTVTFPKLIVGVPITARVSKCNEFGVVLEVAEASTLAGTPESELGWMHISDFSRSRTGKVGDLLAEGDIVRVLTCDVDSRGRGRFSIKALMKNGEGPEKYITKCAPPVATSSAAAAASSSTDATGATASPPTTKVAEREGLAAAEVVGAAPSAYPVPAVTPPPPSSSGSSPSSSTPASLNSSLRSLDSLLTGIHSILYNIKKVAPQGEGSGGGGQPSSHRGDEHMDSSSHHHQQRHSQQRGRGNDDMAPSHRSNSHRSSDDSAPSHRSSSSPSQRSNRQQHEEHLHRTPHSSSRRSTHNNNHSVQGGGNSSPSPSTSPSTSTSSSVSSPTPSEPTPTSQTSTHQPQGDIIRAGSVVVARVASFDGFQAKLESLSQPPLPLGKIHPFEFARCGGLRIGDVIRVGAKFVDVFGQGVFSVKTLMKPGDSVNDFLVSRGEGPAPSVKPPTKGAEGGVGGGGKAAGKGKEEKAAKPTAVAVAKTSDEAGLVDSAAEVVEPSTPTPTAEAEEGKLKKTKKKEKETGKEKEKAPKRTKKVADSPAAEVAPVAAAVDESVASEGGGEKAAVVEGEGKKKGGKGKGKVGGKKKAAAESAPTPDSTPASPPAEGST